MAILRLAAGAVVLLVWGFGQAAVAQGVAPPQTGTPATGAPERAAPVPPAEIPGVAPPPITAAPVPPAITASPVPPVVQAAPEAASDAPRIEWEVKNRFRLFRSERDFQRHVAAYRADGGLAAEHRLRRATGG